VCVREPAGKVPNLFFYPSIGYYIWDMKKNKPEFTKEKILDVAQHLGAAKFMTWANDNDLRPVIENYDDVFDLNRDRALIDVDGHKLEFEEGKIKME